MMEYLIILAIALGILLAIFWKPISAVVRDTIDNLNADLTGKPRKPGKGDTPADKPDSPGTGGMPIPGSPGGSGGSGSGSGGSGSGSGSGGVVTPLPPPTTGTYRR
jgi:hypothetical protein